MYPEYILDYAKDETKRNKKAAYYKIESTDATPSFCNNPRNSIQIRCFAYIWKDIRQKQDE
jgi:hypothetical protein